MTEKEFNRAMKLVDAYDRAEIRATALGRWMHYRV